MVVIKFAIAFIAFMYFCASEGAESNSAEIIGIAILLGGFIAHKDG